MKLLPLTAMLAPSIPSTTAYTVSYDDLYAQGSTSLDTVACSNGEFGLITAGYSVFSDLPTFPFIGGAPQIQSWDSVFCGTCWGLTYTDAQGLSTSMNVTVINTSGSLDGFTLSFEVLNSLALGEALALPTIQIGATQLPNSGCGLL